MSTSYQNFHQQFAFEMSSLSADIQKIKALAEANRTAQQQAKPQPVKLEQVQECSLLEETINPVIGDNTLRRQKAIIVEEPFEFILTLPCTEAVSETMTYEKFNTFTVVESLESISETDNYWHEVMSNKCKDDTSEAVAYCYHRMKFTQQRQTLISRRPLKLKAKML